ncbi:AcrR family transcriptional regulator [Kutzneria viridogrisea]|uniref:AcrR family transcriptional regulator n=1 Tax=Kutzneria viridogrisea TaxID=47990 RepID=A0ABR6BHK2_9PSEU|nr:AcrR family transcriptional regulator [Kutzneria viridogrisea]
MSRTPSGAAVLRPEVTEAIAEAVLDELCEQGFGRLSMERVARRAGVGKSALYRRWPAKSAMVVDVLSRLSVPVGVPPDTGSLRGDLRAMLDAVVEWMTEPRLRRILPDLVAESARNPELAAASDEHIGKPRRQWAVPALERAVLRGELPARADREVLLDLLAAPVFWRLTTQGGLVTPNYLDQLADLLVRGVAAG